MITFFDARRFPGVVFSRGSRHSTHFGIIRLILLLGATALTLLAPMAGPCAASEPAAPVPAEAGPGDTTFEIKAFDVKGNTIFPSGQVLIVVARFIGKGRIASDVEKARDALEKLYHDAGYPAVVVNIPEQTLKDGIVKLEVIETRIGKVTITGNRYFTMEKIMNDLPALAPGQILYLPKLQEELGRLNRNPDFKADPSISPGEEFGTIDATLKVEDHLPLHGYLEVNNRNSHNTTELRLNGLIRYDNLWQMEHSVSFQYQTSPQNLNEVEVLGLSYVLPPPWNKDHQLVIYGIWSDSQTNTVSSGEGFSVIGKGQIFGIRYVVPLPQYKLYSHNVTLGIDYKHFDQTMGFTLPGQPATYTPLHYTPLSFSYNASLPDEWGGVSQFSLGVNMNPRQVNSSETEFENKRYMAQADYIYATAGLQRTQKLPLGMSLFLKVDGQIANEPLVQNEQYSAGGMLSVRGYLESEALGDDAIHSTAEVSFPDPLNGYGIGKTVQTTPFVFYDMARLTTKEPLPPSPGIVELQGAGAGIRGSVTKYTEYEVDWAVALQPSSNATNTNGINRNDERVYFKVKYVF